MFLTGQIPVPTEHDDKLLASRKHAFLRVQWYRELSRERAVSRKPATTHPRTGRAHRVEVDIIKGRQGLGKYKDSHPRASPFFY